MGTDKFYMKNSENLLLLIAKKSEKMGSCRVEGRDHMSSIFAYVGVFVGMPLETGQS